MSSFCSNRIADMSLNRNLEEPMDDVEQLQCLNPQYTDKRYHGYEEIQSATLSNDFMTPCPLDPDSSTGYPSLMLSDTASFCNAGPSSASSTSSSFSSSPDYTPSCSSSASTTTSSRRQSTINHDLHQYWSRDYSPTPASRERRPMDLMGGDKSSIQEPLLINPQSLYPAAAPYCSINVIIPNVIPDGLHLNGYSGKEQSTWQECTSYLPEYQPLEQSHKSACLGTDMVSTFGDSISTPIEGYAETECKSHDIGIARKSSEAQAPIPLQSAPVEKFPLEQPIQYRRRQIKEDLSASEGDDYPTKSETAASCDVKPPKRKNKAPKRSGRNYREDSCIIPGRGSRSMNNCHDCCYACTRAEHLKRHQASGKHNKSPFIYYCKFEDDCTDKEGGPRRIIARNDNYKAHYTKTHFTYGATEKSGKNIRFSMKRSIKEGLRDMDYRWALLLAGQMRDIHDTKGTWKMLGYSILETREKKVKDIIEEWEDSDERTLAAFDPRWYALNNGTMTYEQAMSVGKNMEETPAQGLLGVTMVQTEAMGIRLLDPRWLMLESGEMSIEDSETLGVKEGNLQARRRRRCNE